MFTLRRLIHNLLLPMSFILPIWLTIGRALLGSDGWLTLIYIFTVAPILLIALLIITFLILRRDDVKLQQAVTPTEAILLTAFYAAVILHGFFLVDGGDTEASVRSVATEIFGHGFQHTSEIFSFVAGIAAFILLIAFGTMALSASRQSGPRLKIAIAIIAVLGVGFGLYIFVHQHSPGVKDDRIARDFQLLSQDVTRYQMQNQAMPAQLSQLTQPGYYSNNEKVASRINQYQYKILSTEQFELCATFATNTQTATGGPGNGPAKAYIHLKGYQCFSFDTNP